MWSKLWDRFDDFYEWVGRDRWSGGILAGYTFCIMQSLYVAINEVSPLSLFAAVIRLGCFALNKWQYVDWLNADQRHEAWDFNHELFLEKLKKYSNVNNFKVQG